MAPSLLDHLASALAASVPGKHNYKVHVVRSEPQRSHALFPHATNAKAAKVWHEETLVVLSERRQVPRATQQDSAEGASAEAGAGAANGAGNGVETAATSSSAREDTASSSENGLVPIVALEASLYFIPSSSCALLYVSKVDTTGLSASPISPTRTLVSAFLAYHLLHPPHAARRLRVHVFARAQAQYLFPGSAENASKRVLDDKGLIRWWKSTLERAATTAARETQRFYLVPGLAYLESLPYVPATPGWIYGHPYGTLSSPVHAPLSNSDPAVPAHPLTDHIPAFPDDPKSRFLHSLTSSPVEPSGTPGDYDDAYRALGSATFSAGSTPAQKAAELERQVERERARLVEGVSGGVDEWWERMAFRQECCAGQLVAFFVVAVGEPAAGSGAGATDTPAPVSAAPPPSPSKPHAAPAPRRSALALRPAQYTKHWSTLHNFDYVLSSLPRLAGAVQRWSEGLERACRSTAAEEEEEGAVGVREGDWRARYEREVARAVSVDNPLPALLSGKEGVQKGEKRPVEEEKKVNVLAPRKKKKPVPAAA